MAGLWLEGTPTIWFIGTGSWHERHEVDVRTSGTQNYQHREYGRRRASSKPKLTTNRRWPAWLANRTASAIQNLSTYSLES